MIFLPMPAFIACDGTDADLATGGQKKCTASLEGRVVMLATGGLACVPPDDAVKLGWVTLPDMTGVIHARCQLHPLKEGETKKVEPQLVKPARMQIGPAGFGPMNGHGGKK